MECTIILYQEQKGLVPKHTKTTKLLQQHNPQLLLRKGLCRKLKFERPRKIHLFRSTMAFAMTSAVTLFQVGPMQPGRPPVSNATEGAQLFEKLVSKANNDLPVQPLQCGTCSSTDDSGEYYVVGINSNGEYEWRIVKNSGEDKGVHSTYHSTKKAAIIGQRAKLTWTASNDGTVAAPYVSFLGMSERELPKATCPSGVHKIRGTCRRPLDPKEVALFYEHFTVLYESHVKHGKIPEELFDELGFVEDVDSQGMVRQRRSETDVHSRPMCLSAAPIRAARRLNPTMLNGTD